MRQDRTFAGRSTAPRPRARHSLLWTLRLAGALGLALAVTGCESLDSLNPFDQKKKPLPGERHPVFPQGVPGVDYSIGPDQPSNANASIDLPPDKNTAPSTGGASGSSR